VSLRVPLIYNDAPQFGFDIGTHSVKIVQLRRAGGSTVVQGYGEGYFPRDAVAEGIIADPQQIAKAIAPLLKKLTYGRLTSRRVIIGLPATKLFTRTLQLPAMNSADLSQAVHYEVEQYVPVPIADLYVDYEIINPAHGEGSQMDVVMTAAPRAIVDSYIKLFDVLGLEIGAIEANMTAVVRALLHSGDAGPHSLIMDIGSISSDLTIYDQFIPLTGSVPVGGEQYTTALMDKLGIKIDEATEIKAKFGIGPSGMHAKVMEALDPSLQTVVKEAKRVVKFYQNRGKQTQAIDAVVISGGGARMPGIGDYLHTAVGLPLTLANPWNHLTLKHPPNDYQAVAPTYATAVGLALRGIGE
jgi:type IV pilus assembly protein PilM